MFIAALVCVVIKRLCAYDTDMSKNNEFYQDGDNEFYQDGAELRNTFQSDETLNSYINTVIPTSYKKEITDHLSRIGEKAATEWLELSRIAEQKKPVLTQFDAWGRRVDEITISPEWRLLEKAAAEEGVVATAYERRQGEYSRVYQMALLYLYAPSSAFFSCPLAMTDGAARAIELHGDNQLKANAFQYLTSRDPQTFWTSGQWMTERTGGSDVSGTSTEARHTDGRNYQLHGTKWFTSATTSQMALTLARTEGAAPGSRGLSLFYLELRDSSGRLKNIEVHRLKEKLGTDALPTAELTLHGTPAVRLGEVGEGVKRIASVLNITRIYNSICALSHMRRGLDLAHSYAAKRRAFGHLLLEHALHRKTLQDLEVEFRKCFRLTFYVAELLGKEEIGLATEDDKKILRALTPIVKLYTAKKCIAVTSEVLECFGGAGYVENTHIPRLLRDAQVFSIWEGTTNVLALDFLRACEKEGALQVMAQRFDVKPLLSEEKFRDVAHARELAFAVAEAVIAGLS